MVGDFVSEPTESNTPIGVLVRATGPRYCEFESDDGSYRFRPLGLAFGVGWGADPRGEEEPSLSFFRILLLEAERRPQDADLGLTVDVGVSSVGVPHWANGDGWGFHLGLGATYYYQGDTGIAIRASADWPGGSSSVLLISVGWLHSF